MTYATRPSTDGPHSRWEEVPHVVKLGRSSDSIRKTIFFPSKKKAVEIANAIGFVLWKKHPFSLGNPYHRIEADGYWMTIEVTSPPNSNEREK